MTISNVRFSLCIIAIYATTGKFKAIDQVHWSFLSFS
jgi:hypothetical protein